MARPAGQTSRPPPPALAHCSPPSAQLPRPMDARPQAPSAAQPRGIAAAAGGPGGEREDGATIEAASMRHAPALLAFWALASGAAAAAALQRGVAPDAVLLAVSQWREGHDPVGRLGRTAALLVQAGRHGRIAPPCRLATHTCVVRPTHGQTTASHASSVPCALAGSAGRHFLAGFRQLHFAHGGLGQGALSPGAHGSPGAACCACARSRDWLLHPDAPNHPSPFR